MRPFLHTCEVLQQQLWQFGIDYRKKRTREKQRKRENRWRDAEDMLQNNSVKHIKFHFVSISFMCDSLKSTLIKSTHSFARNNNISSKMILHILFPMIITAGYFALQITTVNMFPNRKVTFTSISNLILVRKDSIDIDSIQ